MKFELSKKFNVKGLIGVSAVALAMIGAGGAINANNNNVHADSFNWLNDPEVKKENKEMDKQDAIQQKESEQQAEPEREQTALQEMQVGASDPDLANDPTIRHFLHKHGYTNHQIKKAVHDNSQSVLDNDVSNPNSKPNREARRENSLQHSIAKSDNSLANSHDNDVTIGGNSSRHDHKVHMPATSSHRAIRRHLSRHTIKGIESTVSKDERAIKRDEKKLNTKSGREFSKNMSYYKDLQSRKASLRRVVRSHHASKRAKRHARKLLRSLSKKAPRQKKMAKKVIAYYVHTSEDMNSAKANLKKIAKAKRTPKNVKKSINKFLNSLNKKVSKKTRKAHKATANESHKKATKRARA